MPSDEDAKLKLAQDIGYIKGTVKGLDGKVDGLARKMEGLEGSVNSKISAVHQSIAGLVRREDCAEHMRGVQEQVSGAITVASQAQAAAAAAQVEAQEAGADAAVVREVTARHAIPSEKPKPSAWDRVVEHSRGLTSILVFLSMLGAGVLALAHFVTRVEKTLATSDELQKQTQAAVTKKLAEPQVVYVKVPGGVDAGAGNAIWVVRPNLAVPKRVPGVKKAAKKGDR